MKTPVLWILGLLLLSSCTTILRSRDQVAIPDHRVILTLDDGPSETALVDDQILDVLKARRVQAAFCLLTEKLPGKGRVLRRMLDEGHTIVFHSRKHEEYVTKSYEAFSVDLKEFESLVRDEAGVDYRVELVRPPAGFLSLALANQISQAGLHLLPATHNPTDTFINAAGSQAYVDGLIQEMEASGGGILVLHNGSELVPRPTEGDFSRPESAANRSWVPGALDRLITSLQDHGFEFIDVGQWDGGKVPEGGPP